MKRKENFGLTFFFILFIAIFIFLLSSLGVLNGVYSLLAKAVSPVQHLAFSFYQNLPFVSEDQQISKLKDENLKLIAKLLDQEKLEKENAALRDQFETSVISSSKLLKAQIIGAPGFIPGSTFPTTFILDVGEKNEIRKNQAVIWKNNLVGKIEKTTAYLSKADLLSSSSFSISAKTEKGALGVIVGEGGGKITLGNVLNNEDIKKGDLVLTKGDLDIEGVGIPPDLIIGRIDSIEKNPSALFQKAKVISLIDFSKLFDVFVVVSQ